MIHSAEIHDIWRNKWSVWSHYALQATYDLRHREWHTVIHRLPKNSVSNFRDLSEAFVGHYLCSARYKQNISTLQNIKMQENESMREFMQWFGQTVLQVESCSMDAILQIFKISICPRTPFFESLTRKPPATMDDLFKRANKYSILEDDVCVTT